MTNYEKYKRPEERAKKFIDFCNSKKGCIGCPIDSGIHLDIGIPPAVKCAYAWEELEYEEKLLPCPFCGSGATLHSSCESWVECNICGTRTKMCACDSGAIEKWNRRTGQ